MMTSYSNFSRRRGPRFSPGTVVGIIIVALFVVVAVLWRSGAQSLVWGVLTPVVTVRNALSGGEVATLRAELASSSAALADRNLLKQQNAELIARLGRTLASERRIIAGVLQAPPGTDFDTLTIDAGSTEGVAVADLVSAGGSSVIGTVSEVGQTNAHVILLSSPGSSHDALVVSAATGATLPVSVAGQGAGTFSAQVPAGSVVAVGDSVVFAGLAGQFVASVSAVDAQPGSSFINLYMHMPVNIFDLRYVEVIKQ